MVKVKVCGITDPRSAHVAAGAGADAIGLVFADSPRRVEAARAREISAGLPDSVLRVGVFVNARAGEILRVARKVGLHYAQLHGDETPETVAAVREGGLPVIKALRVRDVASLEKMEEYEADLFLLDAWNARAYGGTGTPFDWGLAKALKSCANIVISGGLTPENVRQAIDFFEPYGVDASSSLEDSPGKKSNDLIRRFVSAARG